MKVFKNLSITIFLLFVMTYTTYADDIKSFEEQKIINRDINILPEDIPFFDFDGVKHFFDEFDGKTILIIFWATWINESPELISSLDCLKKDFRKLKFDIIALSEDYQDVEKIREFFNKHEIRHLKIYHDYKNKIYNAMQITNLPSFFLLDSDSNNLYQFQGNMNWNDEALRNSLLGFIPNNPAIPKNTSTKTILKFSPEYKSKIEIKKTESINKITKQDLPTANEQDKNIIKSNNEEKNAKE